MWEPVAEMEIAYAPTLPAPIRDDLEQAARRTGLALGRLELLGQDLVLALAFVESVHAGTHEALLQEVDWDRLEAFYRSRKQAREHLAVP